MRKLITYIVAIAFGGLLWVFIGEYTHEESAWDSSLYFTLGLPTLMLLSFLLGIFEPKHGWQWGLILTFSQLIPLFMNGDANEQNWSWTLLVFSLIAIPNVAASIFGGLVRKYLINKRKR